jgi:hypothetical protein
MFFRASFVVALLTCSAAMGIASALPRRATQDVTALPFVESERYDYCGETTPTESYDATDPLQSDCNVIATWADNLGHGHFVINRDSDCDSDGWCQIAAYGTCSFKISFYDASDTRATIGNNDVRFYVESYARDAQNGHIRALGGIACYDELDSKINILQWGMINP